MRQKQERWTQTSEVNNPNIQECLPKKWRNLDEFGANIDMQYTSNTSEPLANHYMRIVDMLY